MWHSHDGACLPSKNYSVLLHMLILELKDLLAGRFVAQAKNVMFWMCACNLVFSGDAVLVMHAVLAQEPHQL